MHRAPPTISSPSPNGVPGVDHSSLSGGRAGRQAATAGTPPDLADPTVENVSWLSSRPGLTEDTRITVIKIIRN